MLTDRACGGDDAAFVSLVEHNQRLVWSIARRWMPLGEKKGATIHDLVQEGNIGLMHAIRKFEPERGFKLTTYATWWLTQRIQRFLAEYGTIRTPSHIGQRIATLRKLERKYPDATDSELALLLGRQEHEIPDLRLIDSGTLSLDYRYQWEGEEGGTLVDRLHEEGDSTQDQSETALLSSALHAKLSRMNPRDRLAVELRFGLDGGGERTLSQVGDELEVTRERARQLIERGLGYLRGAMGA